MDNKNKDENPSEKKASESAKKRTPFKVGKAKLIKYLKISGAVLCLFLLFCGSPLLRSGLNPIACFWLTSLTGIEGSFICTSREIPQFRIQAAGSGTYRLAIYAKETLKEASQKDRKGFEIFPIPAMTVDKAMVVLSQAKPLLSCDGELRATDLNCSESMITLPKPLPAGDYLLVAETINHFFPAHPDRTARCFRVTDIGLIVKQAPDKAIIQAVDLVTLAPRAGVEVNMIDGAELRSTRQARTAADGTAVFKELPAGQTKQLIYYAHAGQNYATTLSGAAYGDSIWTRFEQFDYASMSPFERSIEPYRLHFATDRSAYRPGQTVLFKGTTRCFKSNGLSNIGGNIRVAAEIDDPEGEKVWDRTLITNKFGAFNGSLHLAETAKTGTYSVLFKYPNGVKLRDSFEVIEYRKPEFEVKVVPVMPVTIAGDKLKVKVQANYYFGAPVANAKVQYTVSSRPETERSFEDSQGDEQHFFEHANNDEGSHYFHSAATPTTTGQVVTDQSGEAIVEINTQTAAQLANTAWNTAYSDRLYEVSADVTDVGLKTVSSEGTALVVPGDFSLQVKTDSYIFRDKEPIEATVYARGNDGKPITNRKLSVGFCHSNYNVFSGKFEGRDTALVQTVSTDALGKAAVKFTAKPDFSDANVFAESLDDRGRKIFNETAIYLMGSQFPDSLSRSEKPATLTLDKEFYRPGDIARVLISTPIKDIAGTPAFVSVEGSTVYDYKSVKMANTNQFVEFPIRGFYAPNMYVTVTLLDRRHKPCILTKEIKVYPADGLFRVTVNSDKSRYEPSNLAAFTVKATRLDGTPAAGAEVNLAVADESLFAIHPERTGGIEQAIYSPEENRVRTIVSFQGFTPLSPLSPELWNWQQAYFAIPVAIAIPPIIALSVLKCPPWITLGCILGGAVVVTMMVTGRVSEQERSFQAKSVELESRMVPQAASLSPPPGAFVRTDLRDTVFWSPSLITDAQGIAHASVKMPDNLTTWRATAYAIDMNRSVGSGTEKLITSKSLIARLSLPRFYCEGDSAYIKGIVHNYSGKTQPVRVTLTCSPHFKINEKLVREVTIANDGTEDISWPVTISGSGTATIKLEALGQVSSDALELKIPIRSFGLTDFRAVNGVIKEEHGTRTLPIEMTANADVKSAKYELGLSASQIGPVLGNFSALIDYPYGCTEQTMSRLIPSVVAMRLQKDLGVALPLGAKEKFEAVRTVSMAKLADLQRTDGGWGWWTTDEHSVPYLTAYVLEGLFQLRQVGYPVDQKFIDRGLAQLKDYGRKIMLQPWSIDGATDHARILYVLSLYGDKPEPAAVAWHLGQSLSAPPEALSYLTMAFHNSGNKSAALICYGQLLVLANKTSEFLNWDHTPEMIGRLKLRELYTYRFTGVETTALALQAVLAMEPQNEERRAKIRSWILLQRGKDGWDNTKTTAQVFVSLLADDLATHRNIATNFTAHAVDGTTGKLLEEIVFNQRNMYQSETKYKYGGTSLPPKIVLSKEGAGTLFYDGLLTFQQKLKPGESLEAKSMPRELGLMRDFFGLAKVKDEHDPNLIRLKQIPLGKQIKAGETILMRVRVKSSITVPYVMIEVPLPSGAEVVSKDASDLDLVTAEEQAKQTRPIRWWWSHQDVLDDRVVFFVTNFPAGTCELTTLLRMEMPGQYNINPAQMQGMYTNKVRAYSTPDQLEVLRQ